MLKILGWVFAVIAGYFWALARAAAKVVPKQDTEQERMWEEYKRGIRR
jgi:hypothetical protein